MRLGRQPKKDAAAARRWRTKKRGLQGRSRNFGYAALAIGCRNGRQFVRRVGPARLTRPMSAEHMDV